MSKHIVWSDTLGPMPCKVVGANETHLLVEVSGVTMPVERHLVFELKDGWALHNGQIVPEETGGGKAPQVTTLVFAPEHAR